jgi:transposase-like protein
MDIDLNENNYTYEKLLELFSLDESFDQEDLKQCKAKVLKLHPDKSQLDTKYFTFFFKMYKKLCKIYQYTYHEKDVENFKSPVDINDHFKRYLEQHKINPKTNYKRFSEEFNRMFENVYIKEDKEGWENWLKSDDGMYDKNDIEKSRKKIIQERSLVKQEAFVEMDSQTDVFGKYQGHDIKESHGRPIFDMDVDDEYRKHRTFNSVQEYQIFLKQEDNKNKPIGLQQSSQLLHDKERMLNMQAKNIAYQNMIKQENTDKKYQNYISRYLKLEN